VDTVSESLGKRKDGVRISVKNEVRGYGTQQSYDFRGKFLCVNNRMRSEMKLDLNWNRLILIVGLTKS